MKNSADFRYRMARAPSKQDKNINDKNINDLKNKIKTQKKVKPYNREDNADVKNFHKAITESLNIEYNPKCSLPLCKITSTNDNRIKQEKIKHLQTKLSGNDLKHLTRCFRDFSFYLPQTKLDALKKNASVELINTMDEELKIQTKKPQMKWITTKDLQLLATLLSDFNQVDSEKELENMFMEYKNLKAVPSLNSQKNLCKINTMKISEYTGSQICYWLIPSPFTSANLSTIHIRRKTMVEILQNIDPNPSNDVILYGPLLEKLDSFINNKIDYRLMLKRRAIVFEEYNAYILRMRLLKIVPLPEELWKEERQNIDKYRTDVEIEDSKRPISIADSFVI